MGGGSAPGHVPVPFPTPSGLPCALGLRTPPSHLTTVGRGHKATCTPSSGCSSRSCVGGSYSSGAGVVQNLFFLSPLPWSWPPWLWAVVAAVLCQGSQRGPCAAAHVPLPCTKGGSTCSGDLGLPRVAAPTWANLGLYTGWRHLLLPLGTAGLWGELGPLAPCKGKWSELSVPSLLGVELGGGPEPRPLQVGGGHLCLHSLFQVVLSHESQRGQGGGNHCFAWMRAPKGFQRKEGILVSAQCHPVQSQGSSPPAPGEHPSCGWAALAPGPLPAGPLPGWWGAPRHAMGLLGAGSCRADLELLPWPGHPVPGALMGLAHAWPLPVCLGCVRFGTLNRGGFHHCSGRPGATGPAFVTRSVSGALSDMGDHLPFSSGFVPTRAGFAQICERASRALIAPGNHCVKLVSNWEPLEQSLLSPTGTAPANPPQLGPPHFRLANPGATPCSPCSCHQR